ncbi:MAG: zeta toxin family protein, partial [Clostridiales Family XIII bacterium]|nr:zeta toxin family protein [Clostridiales Family XIII bacterium]
MENNDRPRPVVLAFAGPNGSGKSTITAGVPIVGAYVNADDIKKQLGVSDMDAAKLAEAQRRALLENDADFTFETVLSTDRNLSLLKEASKRGYDVQCLYVLTCNAEINVARVRKRVLGGGHSVPEEKIKERYRRALALLPELVKVCDFLAVYDNSRNAADGAPDLIFQKDGNVWEIFPNELWSLDELKKL